ncbi:hypothetical protein PAXINDRAFT_21163 [Paxillus involutus ATCC 200175]|uniref:Uncharacterized protein n=1 Tax=Paxillus involutus ATCC 200175 TaxID=664439 RepID=A0A0C9SM57_PAXIN|nr:hypothetical protein PAXINDRAFT_21163 [Paxillus involutus ATCC 200175]
MSAPCNPNHKLHLKRQEDSLARALEQAEAMQEMSMRITARFTRLAGRSERHQRQMAHLSLLEALLALLEEGNDILSQRLTALEELAVQQQGELTEFVPLSVDEDEDSAVKPVLMKQSVVQLPAGKLMSENIGKGYLVYDPQEPRKKIGKVIKVKPCQPREIDVLIIGQWPMAAPKLMQEQFIELGEAITTLKAQGAAIIERAEEYCAELRATLIKIQQDNSALIIYEDIEKEMVEFTAEQTRAMSTFKGAERN